MADKKIWKEMPVRPASKTRHIHEDVEAPDLQERINELAEDGYEEIEYSPIGEPDPAMASQRKFEVTATKDYCVCDSCLRRWQDLKHS